MHRTARRTRTLASIAVVAAVVTAFLAGIPAAGAGGTAAAGHAPASTTPQYRGNAPLDTRNEGSFAVQPTANQASARAGLISALGEEGVVDIDPLTGTPRVVARLDGFLTLPSRQVPAKIVTDYVRGHIDAFGLAASDLSTLHLVRDYVDILGTHHMYWVQTFQGVPSFDHGLEASVTRTGQLINVLGSPMSGLSVSSTQPRLSADSAVSAALENSGAADTTPGRLVSQGRTPARTATYANGDSATLVLFGDAQATHLAWQVDATASSTERDLSVVDASTGAVLWRTNQVQYADVTGHGLAWQYMDSSALPAGAGHQVSHSFPVKDAKRLFGNNAHVFADVNDDNHPKPGAFPNGDEIPASTGRSWNYHVHANTSTPGRNCTPKFPCTWNSSQPGSWKQNLRQDGTQVYFYLNNYHNHLLASPIGFTEAAGNFQLVNKTGHGKGNDAVQANVDDGANTAVGLPDINHQANANMSTPPDGHAPTMQMYLFEANTLSGNNPDSDGGDDASIVYHEYTHGLSNRMITDPRGVPALNAFESGAMGEAWSDWYAMDFLAKQGFVKDTATPGDVQVGFFTGGGSTKPIRTEGMDCPVGPSKPLCRGAGNAGAGGYTLGDMGKIALGQFGTFPEVHADGEIWGQTLWQIRQRLIASLGAGTGVNRAESIVTRAMELSPPNPSMIDERNAILQADQVVAGGHDRDLLWSVFANRGMGFFAHVDGADDVSPTQNFVTPPGCSNPSHCGTIHGVITDATTHHPIAHATVGIVDHLTGSTQQSPDNLVDVTAADGSYSIPNVPRHSGYSIEALGYDPASTVSVQSATVTKNLAVHRDWAALSGGATIQSVSPPNFGNFGCPPDAAFDLQTSSGWGSARPTPRQITVRLPHAVNISEFRLDPDAACGDSSSAAVKGFKIETKTASGGFVTAVNRGAGVPLGGFTTLHPTAGAHNVLFVRFTMTSNHGDPQFVDMTELLVHGTAA
jgi:extracellular elastinolytic metalloproteinase